MHGGSPLFLVDAVDTTREHPVCRRTDEVDKTDLDVGSLRSLGLPSPTTPLVETFPTPSSYSPTPGARDGTPWGRRVYRHGSPGGSKPGVRARPIRYVRLVR